MSSFRVVMSRGLLLTLTVCSLAITLFAFLGPPKDVLDTLPQAKSIYIKQEAALFLTRHTDLTASAVLQNETKTTVNLPHTWGTQMQLPVGHGWYEIQFIMDPDKPKPNAVYLPRAIMNAQAYLNGHWIGGHGSMEGNIARHWNKPYLFQFSPDLLNSRHNVLQIQVAGYSNYRSGLGRVWIGPSELLEPIHRKTHLWQAVGSFLTSLLAFGGGVLLLVFVQAFKEERVFLFFGLALVVFALRNVGYFSDWTLVSQPVWAMLVHNLHAWFACLFSIFMIQYMKLPWKGAVHCLWIYAVAATAVLTLTGHGLLLHNTVWWLAPLVPIMLLLGCLLLIQAWKNNSVEASLIAGSAVLFISLSLRDMAIMVERLPNESQLLSQYSGLLLFVAASYILLSRYKHLLEKLSTSNGDLHRELEKREQQLFTQFELIRKIEQQRVQDEERKRIMQDIHDGVGSSLVSALNLSDTRPLEPKEMREVLQECLDDLRMAVDSLDPQSEDLLALLGNFRWRYERRLKASGVTLNWRVKEIPTLQGYSSRDLFDLLRIVQEVFANSLKHAKADSIELKIHVDPDQEHIYLHIVDNGVGMPANSIVRGRGLAHMAIRAKSLGIELYTGSGPNQTGFGVYVRIPLIRQRSAVLDPQRPASAA